MQTRAAPKPPKQLKAERSARWANHRSRLRELTDDIKRAKRRRDDALKTLRAECETARKALLGQCAADRRKLRQTARDAEAKAKRRKRQLWETYRIFSGSIRGQLEPKYSAAEHDQLTEQNISPEYVEFFRAHRALFPRWRSPDDRAVQFGEYVEEHRDEITAWYAARAEAADAQGAYERAYLAHLEERGELEDGELDADGQPDRPGTMYLTMPSDDPVLRELHVTARLDRVTPLGDAYEVRVSHPAGGSIAYEVTEHRHGGWDSRRTDRAKAPSAVTSAVENWIESGGLTAALEEPAPF